MFATSILKTLIRSMGDDGHSTDNFIEDYANGEVAYYTFSEKTIFQSIAEVDIPFIISLEELGEKKLLREAGYGGSAFSEYRKATSTIATVNREIRGDKICFITPTLCKDYSPNLENIQKIILQIVKGINIYHKFNPGKLAEENATLEFSTQLAIYPGDGSRYVRHCDVSKVSNCGSRRRVTVICYFNHTWTGGQIRIFSPAPSAANQGNVNAHIDIDPQIGRLLVFNSYSIEHEVLPCYEQRVALTIWVSADDSKLPLYPSVASITSGQDLDRQRIFVSLVNYRDSEAPFTVRDLFAKAAHPKRIFIGTVFQGEDVTDDNCIVTAQDCPPQPGHLRSVRMHYSEARGPCYARHIAQSLWQGEEYFLQIDSHMRFRAGWDEYLVRTLCGLEKAAEIHGRTIKPILTTYPQGYQLPSLLPAINRPTVLVPTAFDQDGMLRQTGKTVHPSQSNSSDSESERSIAPNSCSGCPLALRSPLWAAGFSFSRSSLIVEVPYDPLLPYLFFGEESAMAARLFTHGYSFFAPLESTIYHLYSRAHRPTAFQLLLAADSRDLPAVGHAKKKGSVSLAALNARQKALSQIRARSLLSSAYPKHLMEGLSATEKDDVTLYSKVGEKYGLGTIRKLEEFEEYCGVSFSRGEIFQRDWEKFVSTCGICDSSSRSFSFAQGYSSLLIGEEGRQANDVVVEASLLKELLSEGANIDEKNSEESVKAMEIIRQFLG